MPLGWNPFAATVFGVTDRILNRLRSSDSASLLYGLLDTGAKVRVGKQPFIAKVKGIGAMGFSAGTLFVTPIEGEGWP